MMNNKKITKTKTRGRPQVSTLKRLTKSVEKPRDFDPFGHAGLSPLVTI